jgi:hypothetical protein
MLTLPQLQIGWRIILPVPIFVVDSFMGLQHPAKHLSSIQ